MTDQNDCAGVTLSDIAELAENGSNFVGAVHVHVSAEEGLNGIDDQQMRPILRNRALDSFIGERQRSVAVVDHQHAAEICSGFDQSRLYRVAESVLCGLINYVEWLKRRHIRQRLSGGACGSQLHGKVGFAFARIALQNGQFAEGDVGIPQPADFGLLHVLHADHGNRREHRFTG